MKTEHWSRMAETGSEIGIRTLLIIYRILGKRGFRFLLKPVIFYYWAFAKQHRTASEQYLQNLQAYFDPLDYPTKKLNSFHHLSYFAEAILNKIIAWRGDISIDDINFHFADGLAENAKTLRSALIIGSHLGDLELCRALSARETGLKVTALVFTRHAVRFNALLEKYQQVGRGRIELLQIDAISPATLFLLQQKIQAGHLIIIVGDRTSPNDPTLQNSSSATFLGKTAYFPHGPYVLAHLLKVPVYLMFVLRHPTQDNRFDFYLELFAERIHLPRALRKQEGVQGYIEKYAARLEHYCRLSPLEWFNFYDFWRK
ncbi:hypothetical protein [Testudinibacter sp. TR-2022]|uniref:hypothetical protein n=1 Tax=Testudinibacter sp. TR-2022 TaxID=2585029 RepID=UPI00111836E2|nr:hypothetical protein [Testudinibacter sp. TR-2022]TNH05997.1 hypothetical protein FHQ30_09345 [Pasteurellaceae bacterium Phil11]TNH24302.1 hypothetical protein FHQ29_03960 [Testudinibacter sp. TR-2022]TNH26893.1 hypothetical protein FHQ27_06505 [Testudinibacter sp. TR-2022]